MERELKSEDFVVDLSSHCFLCLEEISTNAETAMEPSSIHSLKYLSHYLKMNLGKVFNGTGQIPPQLLAKIERSHLKVTLCEGCACLTDKFSMLYRQLEKTKLEVTSCLDIIRGKLLEAEENGRSDAFLRTSDSDGNGEMSGNLEIVEVLRNEAMEKCSDKLRIGYPRVRIHKTDGRNKTEVKTKLAVAAGQNGINANAASLLDNSDMMGQTTTPAKYNRPKAILNPKTEKYKCPLCPREFRCLFQFHDHHKGDHFQQKYKCPECPKKCTFRQNLRRHVRRAHKNAEQYKTIKMASVSGKKSPTTQKYTSTSRPPIVESHELLQQSQQVTKEMARIGINVIAKRSDPHEKIRKKLRILPKSCKTDNGDRIPTKQKPKFVVNNIPKKTVPCNGKQDYSMDPLTQLFKCKKCPREYKSRDSFHRHYKGAHLNFNPRHQKTQGLGGGVKAVCQKCGRAFEHKLKLKYHQRNSRCGTAGLNKQHLSEKTSRSGGNAVIDGAGTTKDKKAQAHEGLRLFNPDTGKHSCSICCKEFSSQHVWNKHYKNVHLKIRYTCELCGKDFTQPYSYTRHYRDVHQGIKSFKCHICSLGFTRQEYLNRHLQTEHVR